MLSSPILHIILASVASAALAFFMYYRNNESTKVKFLLGFLRFCSILVLLLLLFNPKIKKTTYEPVKTGLPILLDNSRSISYLEQSKNLEDAYAYLTVHNALQEHFDVSFFRFGSEVKVLDSLNRSEERRVG